jgi:apolipoprotein N-acyltransferase
MGGARLQALIRSVEAWPALLRGLLFVVLGAVAGLGQVPFALPLATMAALLVIMHLAEEGRLSFWRGWAFGAGYAVLTLHWIMEPFLVEPERTGWLAPLGLLAMAGGFGLFWAVPFWLTRRLGLGPLGLAALWTGAEMVRALALTGFPWVLVGHIWSETPLAQLAAFVGVHGLTLFTLLAAALLASPRLPVALRLLPVPLLAAGVLLLGPGPAPDVQGPLVRIVQPNIPQAEKWDPELVPFHHQRLIDLSRGSRPADLVVWPETAPSDLLEWAAPLLTAATQAAGGAPLATGVARADEEGRYFNSLAVVDATGRVGNLYDKAHLVPFGEYMPFRETLSRWGLRGVAEFQGLGFQAGPGAALVDIPGIGLARPLICYEGIFAEEIGSGTAQGRPRLLLLVTNDAWFGSFAGPQQHLALGRLRAIEQGLPMVRSANTGISAMIDGRGRVMASLPLNQEGTIEAVLPPALDPTLYARMGDTPVALLLLALGLLAGLGPERRRGALDRTRSRP